MDADRFDTIACAFHSRSPRRTMLGLGLGGVLAGVGLDATVAKKKKTCPSCKKRQKGKKGKCKPQPNGTPCDNGVCSAGTCTPCAAGQIVCGSACIDLATNPTHCGSCGNFCGATQLCDRGTCVTGSGTCYAGANTCNGTVNCNGNPRCSCFLTRAGVTRCGRTYTEVSGSVRLCETDAHCAEIGAGAFCPPMTAGGCGGFCFLPC